jgi:hypothetical protein
MRAKEHDKIVTGKINYRRIASAGDCRLTWLSARLLGLCCCCAAWTLQRARILLLLSCRALLLLGEGFRCVKTQSDGAHEFAAVSV